MLKWYDRTVESIYISSYDSQYYKYFAQYLDFVPSEKIVGTVLLLEGFKQQTIKTKWVTAEVDRITALIYFMIIILVFIVAILILPDLLHKFAQVFGDIYLIRLGVLIFSVFALLAVSAMAIYRIRGLLNKAAVIVFRYLTALGAIRVDKEKFKANLHDIEGYLNSNDWVLAEYWVRRIEKEYTELFLTKICF